MKTRFNFFVIVCIVLFARCSKNDIPPTLTDQNSKLLTGDGNRYWRLKAISVNDTLQTLTTNQLKYTKTYTITPEKTDNGTFTNSDGYKGFWSLKDNSLTETINNNPAGPVQIYPYITAISSNTLVIWYVDNRKKITEVYYAY